jgi:hypothetical protein
VVPLNILKAQQQHLPSRHALAHVLGDGHQSANNGYHMGHLAVIRMQTSADQVCKLAVISFCASAHVSTRQPLARQKTKLPQPTVAKSTAQIVAVPIGGGAMIVE